MPRALAELRKNASPGLALSDSVLMIPAMLLRTKLFFVLIPVLIIALLAWLKFGDRLGPGADSAPDAGPSSKPAPAVRVVSAERRPFETSLVFNGNLIAYDSIDVRSELSGRVRAIHFSDGQTVAAGDLIVEIDTEEMDAELRSVSEQLALAEVNAQRQERLFESSGVTARERDEAVSRMEVLRAERDRLESRLGKGTIRAPFAGTLGLRHVSPGDFLDPSRLITTLQTVDKLRLDFAVPERFFASVEKGGSVSFTVTGDDSVYSGEITAINPRIDTNTRSMTVRADVSNEKGKLLPGNFARVEMPLREESVIVVPAVSVVRSLDSVSVFLVEDEKVVRREVTVGERTADSVVIKDGLEPGDVVITDGVQAVREGGTVNIKTDSTK